MMSQLTIYKTSGTNDFTAASVSQDTALQFNDIAFDDGSSADFQIIRQVFDHYRCAFKRDNQLIGMLINRKIDPEYADYFQIGFSDRTLGFELQSPKCLLGSQNRGHLQRLKLLKNTGHEFFQGAVVIPYCNNEGQIMGAYGRRLRQQPRSSIYHLYWNPEKVSFFNISDQRLSQSLILCKSALDALTLLTLGFENVVATMGMQGFNDTQLSRLSSDGVTQVFLAFDNAPRSNNCAWLVAQTLCSVDISCYRIQLPSGQDVNQFAVSQSDVIVKFKRLIDEATPYNQIRDGDEYFKSLDNCIQFYLEEMYNLKKASRTIKNTRIHLSRFQEFCISLGIESVENLNDTLLKSYRLYVCHQLNVFTGYVISVSTQKERIATVINFMKRLHYYGVIHASPTSNRNSGESH